MGQAVTQQGGQGPGIAERRMGVIAGEVDAAGGAEFAQADEGVGHGINAIAQVEHQLWQGLAGLPEVVPQDRPVEPIKGVGHQHPPLQQGGQG